VQAKWKENRRWAVKAEPGCSTDILMMTSHSVMDHLQEYGPRFLRSRSWIFTHVSFI